MLDKGASMFQVFVFGKPGFRMFRTQICLGGFCLGGLGLFVFWEPCVAVVWLGRDPRGFPLDVFWEGLPWVACSNSMTTVVGRFLYQW